MRQPPFSGTGVALVTPFHENKAIDYPTLEKLIEYVIEGGVDFIVSLGTTGEAITLSSQECREVLDFTIKVANGRLPIVAGLQRAGVSMPVLVTYLVSLATLSVIRIPLEVGLIGGRLAAIRFVTCLLLPPVAGVLTRWVAPLLLRG